MSQDRETRLIDELVAEREHARASRTTAEEAIRIAEAAALAAAGAGETALKVGDLAPDFELREIGGGMVSSDELRQRGPLILVFYRGGWCPYCNLELRAWQRNLDDVHRAGANLVAISPEKPEVSAATAADGALHFPVLFDEGSDIARRFGLVHAVPQGATERLAAKGQALAERQGTDDPALPLPATYVVAADSTITYAFVDRDYTLRAEPADVLAALR